MHCMICLARATAFILSAACATENLSVLCQGMLCPKTPNCLTCAVWAFTHPSVLCEECCAPCHPRGQIHVISQKQSTAVSTCLIHTGEWHACMSRMCCLHDALPLISQPLCAPLCALSELLCPVSAPWSHSCDPAGSTAQQAACCQSTLPACTGFHT